MVRTGLWLCGVAALGTGSPALADHMGPTGVASGGGALSVGGADVLDRGRGRAGFRLTYTRPDQRSDAELAALAGEHVHAHNTDYNLVASAGLAYGVTDRLTLSVELPYVRRDDLREGAHAHTPGGTVNGVEELGSVAGIGDVTALAKYKVTGGSGEGFALIAGLKLPTGSTHKRSSEGERLETEHQPGTGSWDPVLGAAGSTRIGELRLDASALYQLSGKGAQDTRLGDRALGGIALSHRFGPTEHHHDEPEEHEHGDGEHHEHVEHGHSSWDAFVELTGEWEGRQKVAGAVAAESGGKSVWLSPGARLNTASGWSIAGTVGLPVWQRIRESHPDNDYRLSFAVGRGF